MNRIALNSNTFFSAAALVTVMALGSGCQSVFKPPGSQVATATPSGVSVDAESYSVELHSNWSNPSTSKKSFSGPVPLQKVVDDSGAARRYRNLDISVVRVSKDTGQIVRMKAKYDPQRRQIEPQCDYDVLANDHVIIKPDNSSPLDDMVKPLNNLIGGEPL
ncbi:MAG: hypothetical protein JNL67_00820 [Planctomycetaceae bacterium]|nr:hypothetical protein [Planctomycetaceae bacterium]